MSNTLNSLNFLNTHNALCLLILLFPAVASALTVSYRYRSPRNPERKVRASTELIVLHTTEAPARSSLNKLCDRGEAHFCVTENGGVYGIVDLSREAFHAGRSMWHGKEDVDKFSIGIECVGYHNKPMPAVQLASIRALVAELKRRYSISDDRVLCHSHVAYGSPNKWHRRKHRGRKRCGMLFAMPSVRRVLGLASKPAVDVDARCGRLVVGDPYLHQVLYGRVDTMAARISMAGIPMPEPQREPSKVVRKLVKPKPKEPAKPKPKVRAVRAKPKVKNLTTTNQKQKQAAKTTKPANNAKTKTKSAAKTKTDTKKR